MMQANTGVRFETKDPLLSQLVKQAEEKCRLNIKNFGGDPVLVEGGGYEKIWLETQPMGGAMYASRDFATGLNNSLMFMRHQRADGRIPGSIAMIDGKVVPQFNKFQGFCFPEPALDLYYLGGKDAEYLAQLAKTLEAFDAYLWRVRDSDGDGCLETWCKYDTGEDHAMRYADAPRPVGGGNPAPRLHSGAHCLDGCDELLICLPRNIGGNCTNQRRCRGTGPVGRQGQSRAGQDGELPVGRCPRRDV